MLFTDEILEIELKKYFGYNEFRPYQKEIIQSLLQGKDVLAILPTGAGKSICYQLPALIQTGTAIVVSPLISLMQDQVVSLFKNGIPAAFINSSLTYGDLQTVLHELSDYKLLYVAPERLVETQFLERLKNISISFFVIDEAHCISQWGHSFRTEYRQLTILKQAFPNVPIIALTATATHDVEKDIQNQLAMKTPTLIKGSFDRPNLTIKVNQKGDTEQQLLNFLEKRNNESGIIYCSTRKGVEKTYAFLKISGFSVEKYHAGLSEKERSLAQHVFLHDQVNLMVATVAFGMGIHKPDVRFIVHMDMPKTIEQYYQEIGRAGRDGLPAECMMFYSRQDFVVYNKFLDDLKDDFIRKQTREKTDQMYKFCISLDCRRRELLRYFGENYRLECQGCDNCTNETEQIDGTEIAQKILSCVYRLKQNVGLRLVVEVLCESKRQILLDRGYQTIPTYGALKHLSEQEVRYYVENLIYRNLLQMTQGDYPVLKWTTASNEFIVEKKSIFFKKRVFSEKKIDRKRSQQQVKTSLQYDQLLYESLRNLRQRYAQEEGVPLYVVFSDRSLQEMAVYFPQTKEEFCRINGVGPIKWVKYGNEFLEEIHKFRKTPLHHQREKSLTSLARTSSSMETIKLYLQGKNIEQIIEERQLARSTILSHLVEAIQTGVQVDISSLVSLEKQKAIRSVIDEIGIDALKPIKEKLPEDISYDDIRLVSAFYRQC